MSLLLEQNEFKQCLLSFDDNKVLKVQQDQRNFQGKLSCKLEFEEVRV